MENILLGITASGLSFFVGCKTVQVFGSLTRIHASFPLLPSVIGLFGVSASSASSRQAYTTVEEFLKIRNLRKAFDWVDLTSHAVIGVLLFKFSGGHFFSLFPSSVNRVGAFSSFQGSLPASIEYATTEQRAVINQIGKASGCHTCGIRKPPDPFISDHMPPVKYANARNNSLLYRLLRMKMTQRFYPQCQSCSSIQAQAVKFGNTVFVNHFKAIRPYHLVGFVLGLIDVLLATDEKNLKTWINKFINDIH